MGDSSASYIHMVQHLIEKCLIFHMTKEECMEALSKHANIEPVITATVWNELEKENAEFFAAYAQSQTTDNRMSEAETSAMIQKMISDHDANKDSDNDPSKETCAEISEENDKLKKLVSIYDTGIRGICHVFSVVK